MLESFFIFDQKFYKQCDYVGMGSPLKSTLANAFMCLHFEKIWLESCLTQFNKQNKNIAFTSEVEQNGLSFLDIKSAVRTHLSPQFTKSLYLMQQKIFDKLFVKNKVSLKNPGYN